MNLCVFCVCFDIRVYLLSVHNLLAPPPEFPQSKLVFVVLPVSSLPHKQSLNNCCVLYSLAMSALVFVLIFCAKCTS